MSYDTYDNDSFFAEFEIVNPTPQVNDPIDQVICAGSQVAAVNFTGTGTSYNWTNTIPSIGLIGSGTGNIAGFTGINNGVNPLIAQISVTPQYLNANLTCSGTIETFSLTIDPLPTVQFSLPNQTICSASASSLVNITSSSPGVTISWSAPTIPSTISGLNLQNGGATIPSFNLTNSGLVPATIQFFGQAVTSSQALCSGPILVYTITVNPIVHDAMLQHMLFYRTKGKNKYLAHYKIVFDENLNNNEIVLSSKNQAGFDGLITIQNFLNDGQ